jgi:nitrogen PTS system EIIA component
MADSEVDITELIHRGGVFTDVEGSTPKEIYKNISARIKLPEGVSAELIYTSLCAREDVLSTAVGNGIALPHARTPIVKKDNESMIVVVYLKDPIDMAAPDERPVTTMFILLTQNSQIHLKVLTTLAKLFREAKFKKALDEKASEETLSALIKNL